MANAGIKAAEQGESDCSTVAEGASSPRKSQGQKRTKKIITWVFVICLLVLFIAPALITVYLYREHFGQRFTTPAYYAFQPEEFPDLKFTKHSFTSNQGQVLTGYYYYTEATDPQAILILVHGFGGGGHNSYMDVANFFAQQGYGVFAYDATGNDESEGEGVFGPPQVLIDLDYAISYVETSGQFPQLPIVLWGHSWGAYATMAVLNFHPEIRAVAGFSGCNTPLDIIEAQGQDQVGVGIKLLLPYLRAYEKIRFGKYADLTAMDGIAASKAPVMFVQGDADTMIPPALGYDLWQTAYGDDPRFHFILRPGFGHNSVYYNQRAMDYLAAFKRNYKLWEAQLPYDPQAAEYEGRYLQDKSNYIKDKLDRYEWTHLLDEDLMQEVSDFYQQQTTGADR